jgi:hypothetical protein
MLFEKGLELVMLKHLLMVKGLGSVLVKVLMLSRQLFLQNFLPQNFLHLSHHHRLRPH